ncbi:protein SCO1/2 [Chitinophaga eiseniae]|uniref:Protein SCO1/2 n=1 Tax=Chitinophaga eiseniae TaxID=634771 RepID=A0A1T4TYF7_9BACT|nr:SCO family protein [Chitinophaga eiseniae]SKA45512.1 protein SCO1/2 [Chitinophaga eiseniae]
MRVVMLMLAGILLLGACRQPAKRLPYLGTPVVTEHFRDGKTVYDSAYPVVPDFSLTDQDSMTVTPQTFQGKIYIADFIFLSCPTICPKMNANMQQVYQHFKAEDRVNFLSHTIDPKHDTIPRLKAFANSLQITDRKWRFVTGDQDSIFRLAEKGYYVSAVKDSTDPVNYIHSGGMLLIDAQRHIRGIYDGTNKEAMQVLINDVQTLLKEDSGKI